MTIKQMPMQLMVEAKDNKADLYINGDITKGFQFFGLDLGQDTDVAYQDVVEALNDLPSEVTDINVHINSYGGEVAEGVAIYNALKSHSAHVTTVCEGFACSIASVIFMAGDVRVMRASSLLMLHNAAMPAHGDANAHRKAADDLDVITELSKTAYLSHATDALTREKLTEVMDAETWVSPEQALEWGLATEIDEPTDADEPTQSARNLVASALLYPATLEVAEEHTPAWAEQLFTKISELEQLITNEPDPAPEPEPEPDAADAPATEPDNRFATVDEFARKYNERFAQIFQQLATSK